MLPRRRGPGQEDRDDETEELEFPRSNSESEGSETMRNEERLSLEYLTGLRAIDSV